MAVLNKGGKRGRVSAAGRVRVCCPWSGGCFDLV